MTPASRDSLFRVLHAISRSEVKARRSVQQTPRHRLARRLLLELAALPFFLAIILLGVAYLYDQPWLLEPSLAALIIAYVGGLSQPLIEVAIHRRAFFAVLRHPFGALLGNALQTTTVDMKYMARLQNKSLHLLELVHLEVKSEREFFERRISLVVGAIDKLGLAPGLLAALLSVYQFQVGDRHPVVLALAYATPALYLLGAAAHLLVMRLDRMTKLLELTITRKNASSNSSIRQRFSGKLEHAER